MKKDRIIANKLNEFADSMNLPADILNDARLELAKMRATGSVIIPNERGHRKTSINKWRTVFVSFILICIVAIAINAPYGLFKFDQDDYSQESSNYSLTDLTKINISESFDMIDFESLGLDEENSEIEAYSYEKADIIYVTGVEVTVLAAEGTDRLKIYIDNKGGVYHSDVLFFSDEEYASSYNEVIRNDNTFYVMERYQDGEYYTCVYYVNSGIDMYMTIESPNPNKFDEYLLMGSDN